MSSYKKAGIYWSDSSESQFQTQLPTSRTTSELQSSRPEIKARSASVQQIHYLIYYKDSKS